MSPQAQVLPVLPEQSPAITIPPPTTLRCDPKHNRLRQRVARDTYTSPVNQNGSFESDRVVKSGHVQKRTQKTKAWKPVYLVLRPNALFIYKTEKEDKLRHKINLSDLTAVALLKDPKHRRKHVFGCFSPARNYHFQANNEDDAHDWVELIRGHARIDEEEEELLLASPTGQHSSYLPPIPGAGNPTVVASRERFFSSSPEPFDLQTSQLAPGELRRPPTMLETAGYSGNELGSHSDLSDTDVHRMRGMSIEDLAVQHPATGSGSGSGSGSGTLGASSTSKPMLGQRNSSQASGLHTEHDPDRVIWHGWLWLLRNKGGVRQWKRQWAVLRPRNFILYKDESEYTAQFIRPMSSIVDVVDVDPISRTKINCLQLITEEKSYRFCAPDEESLVHCLGAFKSLLAKRRELEARAAAGNNSTPAV
ncbi:PH-domain-containing protein [Sodiomyces alkalinus F11]|uniref:PH-domain-containing protein n=1 Tax=Sodiomyces alkalinus (strain CBS 110278 / VKM F-3762 / F11) TaxID=1314773 RepID=A0A3N2Q827_SODAK|nr:PH-domain-containing protein [Sodiomyces alkalinus F11]ROT42785.1 PH-domain-containing protein [Sodiomyces alkalinus F11]